MRKAFTLIELLVVVAVIAALAALLFPVLARARERAKMTHCANNLKQLGTAIRLYMDDWDNRYPAADQGFTVHSSKDCPFIHEVVRGYIRPDDEIWICPSDWGEIFWSGPIGFEQRTTPFHKMIDGVSYGYFGYGRTLAWGELAGKPESWVKKPSIGVLMVEFRPWHSPCDPWDNYYLSPAPYNVLYCDGHIARKPAPVWLAEQKAAIRP